jgi:hypothetical protein
MTDLCNLRLCLNSKAVPRVLRVACSPPHLLPHLYKGQAGMEYFRLSGERPAGADRHIYKTSCLWALLESATITPQLIIFKQAGLFGEH